MFNQKMDWLLQNGWPYVFLKRNAGKIWKKIQEKADYEFSFNADFQLRVI